MGKKNVKNKGITLVALVITIVILILLAGVSITLVLGENGIITKAKETKIMTAIGSIKEEIDLDRIAKKVENKEVTVEQLLAEGKIKRKVQQEGENYYIYYAIKSEAYNGMQNLGKEKETRKDVFLIDDDFNIGYIDKNGKEYGEKIKEKILLDETEVRFASKEFSKYISKIAGIKEEEMKFKWMKNQISLTIEDSSITSLNDLAFFPNLETLILGTPGVVTNTPSITTLDGIENCPKLKKIEIFYCSNKDYTGLKSLKNLQHFKKVGGNDFDNIIDNLKECNNLNRVYFESCNVENMKKISELTNLKVLTLSKNNITKIEGLNNLTNLEELDLSKNNITKIEGLSNLNKLKTLNLEDNQITDITPLSVNTALVSLNLKKNRGIDGNRNNYTANKLEELNKIGEILDRDGTIFLDVDKIQLFTNYKKLNLSSQNLTTLEQLKGMTELIDLNLSYNLITLEDKNSQEILKSMTKLNKLNLENNKITNITPINSLSNLKELNVIKNDVNLEQIEDIISNLDNLSISNESLNTISNCDTNKIINLNLLWGGLTTIPDLSVFTKLEKLQINMNKKITNYSIISKITSLQSLELNGNELHGKMIDFSKLTNLTTLDLQSNGLWSEDLTNLQVLKNHKDLKIDLRFNSITDASALLVLDPSCKIDLRSNVNLTPQSQETLKARFGKNVIFN